MRFKAVAICTVRRVSDKAASTRGLSGPATAKLPPRPMKACTVLFNKPLMVPIAFVLHDDDSRVQQARHLIAEAIKSAAADLKEKMRDKDKPKA